MREMTKKKKALEMGAFSSAKGNIMFSIVCFVELPHGVATYSVQIWLKLMYNTCLIWRINDSFRCINAWSLL